MGGTFAPVIREFLGSEKFKKLAVSTQTNYRHTLTLAEHPDTLGAVPVEELRPALVQAFLDGFSDRPAQQKCAQTALKSLEKWAIVRDKLPYPITLGTEAPGGPAGMSRGRMSMSRSPSSTPSRTLRGSSRSPPTRGSAAPISCGWARPISRTTKGGRGSTSPSARPG
jgi:hypothetical protein